MEVKFVYVIVSDEIDFCVEQAILSMHTLLQHNPDGQIVLLADSDTLGSLTGSRSIIKNYVSSMVAVDVPDSITKRRKSRYIKTSMRKYIEGDFLFIDCDTIITGKLDMAEIDSTAEIAAVISRHKNEWSRQNPHRLISDGTIDLHLNSEKLPPVDDYYNSGVLLCRDTPRAHEFFDIWHNLWLRSMLHIDQPFFWISNAYCNNIVKPLSGIYNCQIIYDAAYSYVEDAKIIHYIRNSNYAGWMPFKNENYLAMVRKEGITQKVEKDIANLKQELLCRRSKNLFDNRNANSRSKQNVGGISSNRYLNFIKRKLRHTSVYRFCKRAYKLLHEPYYLDLHLVENCNLGCRSCSHYSPIAPAKTLDLRNLKEDLAGFSRLGDNLKIFNKIYLVGGEPLLHPQIDEVIRVVRSVFTHNSIHIITNGIMLANNPEFLPKGFWAACRECNVTIEISRYPINIDLGKIDEICKEEHINYKIFRDRGGDDAFKLMRLLPKRNGSLRNYYSCPTRKSWQIKDGRIYGCPQSAYVEYVNNRFGTEFKHRIADSFSIRKISFFKIKLFRLFPKPFCRNCEFPRKSIKWESTRKAKEEWLAN